MNNSIDTDTKNVSRKVINIRAATYDEMDGYREEVEIGKKMFRDEWFRKLIRAGEISRQGLPTPWCFMINVITSRSINRGRNRLEYQGLYIL